MYVKMAHTLGCASFFAARGAVFGWRLAEESACFASGDILFVDSGKKYAKNAA